MNQTSDAGKFNPVEPELQALEQRMGELLALVHQLAEENHALRNRQETLSTERAALLHRNEQVRTRVEAMIGRLRTMETGV
jgi:cell division protein ZapB